MNTKLIFHVKHEAKNANHGGGHIAHIKHTLYNPRDLDTVLCLVTRRHLSSAISIQEMDELAKRDGDIIEPVLRDLAQNHGFLD